MWVSASHLRPDSALRAALVLVAALALACASSGGKGFYYTVEPGDNLYRISQRFGTSASTLARQNRIEDVRSIPIGTKLWISGADPGQERKVASLHVTRARAQQESGQAGGLAFSWPVRGELTSRFGKRNGRSHEGIDLSAKRGTEVRAAEAGKVIHNGWLRDYGRVVILKHAGDFRSVYAHLNKSEVRKGQFVERRQTIAEVGTSGNASGPHLHFEIRRNDRPQDPMRYLP